MNDEIYPLDSGEANVPVPWAPPTARRLRASYVLSGHGGHYTRSGFLYQD